MADDYLWDPDGKPDPVTAALERQLRPLRYDPEAGVRRLASSPTDAPTEPDPVDETRAPAIEPPAPIVAPRRSAWRRVYAVPLVVGAMAAAVVGGVLPSSPPPSVEMARKLTPPPPLAWGGLDARLAPGAWLETGDRAVKLSISDIGHVTVAPGSRVRTLDATADLQRLELARGRIDAEVVAPPRLFLVETPITTAVDLGCAYRLEVDEAGKGSLHVTSGAVALQRGESDVTVPAGARCEMTKERGVGTPYYEDAPPALRAALAAFDFGDGGAAAVRQAAAAARPRDALSLWHLVQRTEEPLRREIYARLTALKAPPTGVTPERAIELEPAATEAWNSHVIATW